MPSNQLDSTTVSLAYDVHTNEDVQPDKNPIILIHGLFWNKFMYRELGRNLSKVTKRKVFALDLRNHDQSPSCERCDSLIMTEDIKRFMREQNLNKVTFICHSFSSTMAYLIALEHPESVEKIVMLDHAPFGEFSEKIFIESALAQFNSQNRFLRTLEPTMSLAEAKREILSLCPKVTKGQEVFLRKVVYELEKQNNKFKWKTDIQFLLDRYAEKAFLVKPRGSSNHEILIVRCVNSTRVSDSKFKDVLRHNPNARMETFEDTTHLLMFEDEERFLETVKSFLGP